MKKIAIQGIKGAFHEVAARQVFGDEIIIEPCITFLELSDKLKNREVDYATMAIENTISGTILNNYELIRKRELQIIGEVYLRIEQNLAGIKGADISKLKEVSSHYMALNQCREFFESYPDIHLVESPDTALSIREVAEAGDQQYAAIGSKLAIEQYGLELLAAGIETNKKNYTRFAVLGNKGNKHEGNKVSASLILSHEPGALSKVLSLLHLLNINLTKIESTPVVGKPFQYRFYLDFIVGDRVSFETTIEALTPHTEELIILGKYKPDTNEYNEN